MINFVKNLNAQIWLEAIVVLYLLLLPFNHLAGLQHTLLAIGVVAAWKISKEGVVIPPKVKRAILTFAAFSLMSVTWSYKPWFSLREVWLELGLGLMTLYMASVYAVYGKYLHLVWMAILFSILGTATYTSISLGQAAIAEPWDSVHGYGMYSTYLSLAWPILIFSLFNENRFLKAMGWLTLPTIIWIAYKTENRMSLLVMAIILIAGGLLWYKRVNELKRFKWPLFILSGMAVAGISYLFTKLTQMRPVDAITGKLSNGAIDSLIHTFTQSERIKIWSYWIPKIFDNPWGGMGFGRDLPHQLYLKPPEWPVLMFAHAHNVFIDIALQLGLVGLCLFLWVIGELLREFYQKWRNQSLDIAWAGWLGVMLVLAFGLKNFTDDFFWRTGALLFWTLSGLFLGVAHRKRNLQA